MLIFADIVNQTRPASKTLEQWRSSLNRYLTDPAVREVMGATNHPNYEEASLSKFLELSDMAQKGEIKPSTLAAVLRGRLERDGIGLPETDVRKKYIEGTEKVQTETVQPERTASEQAAARGQALARRNMVQMPGEMVVALPAQATELLTLLVETVEGQAADRRAVQALQQQTADLLSLVAEKIGEGPTVARDPALPNPPPPEDRLITNEEAAALVACTSRGVGRLLRRGGVEPHRPGVWRRSDVLRFIQMD